MNPSPPIGAVPSPPRTHLADTPWAWLAIPVLISAVVWFPITRNYFFGDDFLNLYQISNEHLLRYLVTPNGGHVLLTRNAIFYSLHGLFGPHPEPYYWSSLLTHLLNVGLLFLLVRRTTASSRLASLGALLWGTSPVNAESLGWYAVYGHVFVGTVKLAILSQATRLADEAHGPTRGWLGLWLVLALMAATSFGTGLAVAVMLPAVLSLWLPADLTRRTRLPPLASLTLVVPALYLGLLWTYEQVSGDQSGARVPYRAMSEPVLIARLTVELLGYGLTKLLLGSWHPGVLDVRPGTVVLFVFLGVAAVLMYRHPGLVRRRLAACLLLLLGTYGTIALGRAFLLATSRGGEVHTVSRYQYVGTLVWTLALCLILHATVSAVVRARVRRWPLLAWYAFIVAGCVVVAPAIDNHDAARMQTRAALDAMRGAILARPPGEEVGIDNRAFSPLLLPSTIFPGWAAVFIIFHPTNAVEGRAVHFLERNAKVVEALRDGRRTGTLLVVAPAPSPPPHRARGEGPSPAVTGPVPAAPPGQSSPDPPAGSPPARLAPRR